MQLTHLVFGQKLRFDDKANPTLRLAQFLQTDAALMNEVSLASPLPVTQFAIFIFQFSIFNSFSFGKVLVLILEIVLPVFIDARHLLIGHLPAHLRRRAHDH